MSHLDHIIATAKSKGAYTDSWLALKNTYFRGENAVSRVQEWANQNNLNASFDYLEQGFDYVKIQSVTFYPKPSPK
jgi:hypothetical protein